MKEFDLVVIGGGSGGVAAARRAASHGAKVALLEAKKIGGTCVNVGCVPKKLMFNAASLVEALAAGKGYGLGDERPRVNWGALKRNRDSAVARLNGIYESALEASGVTVLRARGRLVSANVVEVDGAELHAPHILLATGGYPTVPDIPGAQLGLTSNGFFELEQQPKRVAIIGTGYIGVELSGILRALGSHVCLLSKYDDVLVHFDPMIQQAIRSHLLESGVEYHPHAAPTRIARGEDGKLKLSTESDEELGGYDVVLWAVGRMPASAGLGLEDLRVKRDERGFVQVDERDQTSVDGVYAIGDVTGRVALTPVAVAAGRTLADRLFGNKADAVVDYQNIPSVVFSHPPVGSVGLTEEQARTQYEDITVYTSSFTNLFYALGTWKPKTDVKLITVGPDERVVGLHICGMGADEMLQGFAVAIKMGATKADFDRTIAIHPTAAEEVVTLR